MGIQEYRATGGNKALLKEYHRKSDSLAQWQINFSKYDAQTYAFDQIASGDHGIFATDEYYPKSGNYDFRYKSVECGKNDKVIVDFGAYPQADSVIFKDKYGVKLKVVDGNILSFTGVSKADTNYIYAYRGDKKIGKLFLNTYQPKKYQVVFVKVNNGAPKLKEKEVKEVLNKVYNQCAVQFEIISTDTITIKDLTTFSHGGSGILTVYNEDQKKVLRAYDNQMQDGIFYLFFIDNVTDKKDGNGTPVSGYMPRGYNAGFIYDGGSPHTIAHELGHGIAGLEHVFENSNNSGKTANLMDYSILEITTELWYFQWDQIQDPSRVWMKWNKAESEGENVEDIIIPRTNWRLVIYSPDESKKFLKAYEKNDYYEMRRITYYSLFHEFEGKNKDWWQKQEKFCCQSLRPIGYSVARLDYFEDAKEGMTVILSTYDKNMNIVFNPKVLYFKPFLSWMQYLPYFLLDVDQTITHSFEGICYPMDINLYDKETKSLDGKEFYGEDDFKGVEIALSGMAGVAFDNFCQDVPTWQKLLQTAGIGNGFNFTVTYGSMLGYGVCIYASKLKYSAGLDVGVSIGKNYVSGKFTLVTKAEDRLSNNNYWADMSYYGPYSLEGLSRSFNASLLVGSYEHWEGLNSDGSPIWEGKNKGISLGIGLDGGFNYSSENSMLIPLKFIFENY